MLKLVARKIPQVLERRVLYPTKFSKRFSSLINIRLSTLNNEQFSSKFLNRGRNLSTAPESNVETREFRAETKQLLDIVTNSIYTDKEVFLRELISNASDALEKLRYKQVIGEIQTNDPLEIQITSNKNDKTLTIVDNGIGMSKEDLINNLGIIARSGSKQFIESIQNDASAGATTQSAPIDPHRIIGQFGVGFYSSFMIADTVTVESIPAVKPEEPPAQIHRWSSDGSGVFTIERLDELPNDMIRGTRIIIKLKEMHHDFLEEHKLKDKKDITPSQYKEFYKFVANAYDEPRYTLHFRTDVPIDLKVLLFVPNNHTEKFGSGQMERGVNLYSRKILIESKPEDLLPNWLRFMKGVVDSEDIPLSLSREKAQDSNLLRRIREVVTRRIIKHLEENMKEDIEKYKSFYLEFAYFLKEGVCSDSKFSEQVAKLLMFESSSLDAQTLTNLDEYISRCVPEQKEIFFLVAPSREVALQSPYMETFKTHGREVLLMYTHIDDFVMSTLRQYTGRHLVSIEKSSIDLGPISEERRLPGEEKVSETSDEKPASVTGLTDEEATHMCKWLKSTLGSNRVKEVKTTTRLSDSPAIVTNHESSALRKMMKMLERSSSGSPPLLPPQILEINPKHPIIVSLHHAIKASEPEGDHGENLKELAISVAEQVFDNAKIAAGLADDPRDMLPRLNRILQAAMSAQSRSD